MPAPPCATGRARYGGSQKNSPKYANCTAPPSAMIKSVRPSRSRPKITLNGFARGFGVAARSVQLRGSRTLRRIQSVYSAGSTPTRNSQRQPSLPNRGLPSISAASTAAMM